MTAEKAEKSNLRKFHLNPLRLVRHRGHKRTHQIGLDPDIWLTSVANRRLSPVERDGISATDVVGVKETDIGPKVWTSEYGFLLETVVKGPEEEKDPAIYRPLQRSEGGRPGTEKGPAFVGANNFHRYRWFREEQSKVTVQAEKC